MTTSCEYSVRTLVYMYAPVIAVVAGRKGFSNAVCFPPVNAMRTGSRDGSGRGGGSGNRGTSSGGSGDRGTMGGGSGDRGTRGGGRGGCKNRCTMTTRTNRKIK